jgi:protein-S-isoprenylcysteine O-methyltransferase Ste14
MSNIPAFEIGLWNAWIFMLPHVLTFPLFFRLAKAIDPPNIPEAGMSKPMLSFCCLSKMIYFPAVIYSVFLPLKLGTVWFYTGLPLTLIGLAAYAIFLVNWANTPPGKPVTKGLYRYSRNPMYVSSSLLLLGVTIASASWVFLLITIIITVGEVVFIGLEEQGCLERYGDVYREYMQRTPRWIGTPKSGKR